MKIFSLFCKFYFVNSFSLLNFITVIRILFTFILPDMVQKLLQLVQYKYRSSSFKATSVLCHLEGCIYMASLMHSDLYQYFTRQQLLFHSLFIVHSLLHQYIFLHDLVNYLLETPFSGRNNDDLRKHYKSGNHYFSVVSKQSCKIQRQCVQSKIVVLLVG